MKNVFSWLGGKWRKTDKTTAVKEAAKEVDTLIKDSSTKAVYKGEWQKPRSKKVLRTLAGEIADGHVYGTWCLGDRYLKLVHSIFMPLIFMDIDTMPINAVHFYEYLDKAGPMSVNGQPIFVSFYILVKEEIPYLMKMISRLNAEKKRFKEGPKWTHWTNGLGQFLSRALRRNS